MAFSRRLKVILVLSAVLIAVQAINSMTSNSLLQFGIMPRSLTGLRGIVFAPFLHGSIQHLLSNLLPFIVLSWLVATEGVRRYAWVAGLVCLLGGLLVWSFGRSNIHVGASGLIFGLWAYLLARAWYQRSIASVLIALLVLAAYSGLVFGFVPVAGVSFESHIAGALAGVCVAWLMHSRALLAQK
ncbi:rhomboid family intramembrane serine protease [Pseudomonas syringae pv. syringae]|uniref:Rhomboid family intramembrane serine protease n=1 Tax=Pseudomonas syringae UB303 TaxID=1357287 RepID=A0AAJ4E3G5_PSESX|nr:MULTISPECIES: rhomboid family intramembrane serine protease [Pseudomonas]KTB77521.1 protease [Pseudomonas syringae pv. syringae PD2774]KTB85279.1 protease [Pseudomonas syringae ICMP 13102]KWS21334.1 rhomboid family intramembrane serine protease [Pseudomonas syringae pv. syringae]MCA5970273.1 rhomboid family intramembrane serine protease [Pseudomonas sp. P135]MCH5488223.1 rhomboid family intramembrane serine protease [Pseudomonas syringae pv. syringae]